jgi:hypothetical protein
MRADDGHLGPAWRARRRQHGANTGDDRTAEGRQRGEWHVLADGDSPFLRL